ncbi:capsule biosynthesis protein CapK [candidate division KSB1 bacterium]|nr:capsule biosynthesis protein CapK [candidate division KSB1 bacterium]
MNKTTTTESERYPTLTDSGRKMLKFLQEHPNAPIFRNQSGNRLSAEDVKRVIAFEKESCAAEVGWIPNKFPGWLSDFVERCFREVPYYRSYGGIPLKFYDIPTIHRGDLSEDIAQFFPDDVSIDRLINFRTSGTTGHPLLLASHPVVAANYLAFHKRALKHYGIELKHGRGQVGVALIGFQRRCFTYVSVTPTMGESGLVKINLHPSDWRDPEDRALYLDAIAAEIYTGDPISFSELAKLPVKTFPRAMLSTSMTLQSSFRRQLEKRFQCPVLDLYSLNEAGPIAFADKKTGGYKLLQHCMYIEITDRMGRPVKIDERGEITLTGGFNFCLPLLRYRTGDYATLKFIDGEPMLFDLEGRPPVRFRTMTGEWINNIEITHSLLPFSIPRFTLHQYSDGSLLLQVLGTMGFHQEIRDSILELFGKGQKMEISEMIEPEGKMIQYTSDLEGSLF